MYDRYRLPYIPIYNCLVVLIKEYSLLSTNTGPILENTTNHPICPYRMVGCIFQYHIQGHFNCQKAFSISPISVVSRSVESTQSLNLVVCPFLWSAVGRVYAVPQPCPLPISVVSL